MTKVLLSQPSRPASHNSSRAMVWVRKNLFSSWSNSLLTIGCIWLMWELIPPLLNWAFLQANWVGSTRADCTKAGACWVFIHERFGQFMYGLYPHDQRWRINLVLLIGLVSIAPMFWKILPHRGRYIAVWAVIYHLYAPTQKEVDHARRVVEAAEAAAREGLGVVSLNGKMVDGPVIDRARLVLSRAELSGIREE